jgi:CspA family cold shock protein
MGRGRDFRGGGTGRRRDYEEREPFPDYYPPKPIPQRRVPSPEPAVDAVVKWFKKEKGFGFVEVLDGAGDAFLHVKVLQSLGRDEVSAGARLTVVVAEEEKGRRVSKVVAVQDDSSDQPSPNISPNPTARPDMSSAIETFGIVKWFSEAKGMGFVADERGGKDVFVHASAVQAAHLSSLAEGQRVLIKVIETDKGRKAVSVALPPD